MTRGTDWQGGKRRLASDIPQLQVFVAVAETQSFSAAARRLGISGPSVTRLMNGLEASLGVRLVQRTTRKLSMTQEGEQFYKHARNIIDELGLAETEASETAHAPKGNVRLSIPSVFASRVLSPNLPAFLKTYPEIRLEFFLTSELPDLLAEDLDLAIELTGKAGIPATPGFAAVRIAAMKIGFFASSEYLDRHGTPATPEDLYNHNCICGRTNALNDNWPFNMDGQITYLRMSGNLVADNGELIAQMVKDGLGIALLPEFVTTPSTGDGPGLVRILEEYSTCSNDLYAILPRRQYSSRRTRILIDFIKSCFATTPGFTR